MLLELRIKNLGIIEDILWRPEKGFNVITGETGAGKSLIIDAVEILLNGSAGEDVIRHGSSELRIEGIFDLSGIRQYSPFKAFLEEKGLATEEDQLIISFELKRSRGGQSRIDNRPVTKSILRQASRFLVDIHSQSQHLSLLDEKSHLEILDAMAGNKEIKQSFSLQTAKLRELETELNNLKEREQETLRKQEFLRFQVEEIRKANLHEGEDTELEQERHIIAHAAKIKEQAMHIYQTLSSSEFSANQQSVTAGLSQAFQSLRKLSEMDSSLQPQVEVLEKAYYGVEECARDILVYADKMDFDPARLEEIESRLESIRSLKRKYGKTLADIIAYGEKSMKDLDLLDNRQEHQAGLEKAIGETRKACGVIGSQLSTLRSQAARTLKSRVEKELGDLEMGQMVFDVSVTQKPSPNGIPGPDGQLMAFNTSGMDTVEFLVSTNPGEPLKPLARIASTGEISRFTLALKGAMAEADQVPLLIFDEIDIGVGGRSGDIVGKKMWNLARHHQVICVTHLPQIAAFADAHFAVRKETAGERSISALEFQDKAKRLRETAMMLDGPEYSSAALKNARQLLETAVDWKKESTGTEHPIQMQF
ncbi:MAG TPA: DNA repair protein RecN [Dehalococcoidales bacterium]|nr:DNA repair protein RecN [Dehalococcoidales bacterium]